MSQRLVVGIDVGGPKKGFHTVAFDGRNFRDPRRFFEPDDALAWCIDNSAVCVAIDSPCGWSIDGKSRQAERDLMNKGVGCFSTPMRESAKGRKFYEWVFNGSRLYESLRKEFALFVGKRIDGRVCIETFPHAVVCALAGRVLPAKPKARRRRQALSDSGFDTSVLRNVDFLDAGLCALAADRFQTKSHQGFGRADEGLIVVPRGLR